MAAGNCVIFKPAPETVLTGWVLVQNFWNAGIGRDVLQFLPCSDDPVGSQLIKDPRIASVVLTGATSTAKLFLDIRPGLDLIAETGGKNAMVISKISDRELAIKCLVQSAFSHSGQKCSACSLAICEAEVYDDPSFRQSLRDAAASLLVDAQWNLAARVTPLIKAPNPILMRALTTLEEGEEWLLEPKCEGNPNLWSPGIKIGVRPGSFTHQTELFGPVLGLMRAENLAEALKFANGTAYGLTAGLHSLDEREHQFWIHNMEAGNLYINRGMTGAVVQRQPFGGCKESSFGRGAKAGGPNYLMQLMTPIQAGMPSEKANISDEVHALKGVLEKNGMKADQMTLWNSSIGNYSFYWTNYFQKRHDPSCLVGQDNFLYYVPRSEITLRVQEKDELFDIFAGNGSSCYLWNTIENQRKLLQLKSLMEGDWQKKNPKIQLQAETEEQLVHRVRKGQALNCAYWHIQMKIC